MAREIIRTKVAYILNLDEADAGGTKQTMSQLNEWTNSKSAFYGMFFGLQTACAILPCSYSITRLLCSSSLLQDIRWKPAHVRQKRCHQQWRYLPAGCDAYRSTCNISSLLPAHIADLYITCTGLQLFYIRFELERLCHCKCHERVHRRRSRGLVACECIPGSPNCSAEVDVPHGLSCDLSVWVSTSLETDQPHD